jgi:cell division septation protein DedD
MKGHPPSPSPFLAEGETCGSLRSKIKSRRWQYGGTLLGLAFGLVVGVLISFGVVWYLNKTPLPFVEKVSKQEPREKNGAAPAALPGKPGDKPISTEKKFEFYDILEGKKPAAPGATQQPAAPVAAVSKAAEPPAAVPAPAVPTTSGQLYLQVGAFQKAADADSLKGKLAMLGFEAGVSETEVPEKGLMRRVRVGPYADTEQMNRARVQLSQQGIPATVVRVKE